MAAVALPVSASALLSVGHCDLPLLLELLLLLLLLILILARTQLVNLLALLLALQLGDLYR